MKKVVIIGGVAGGASCAARLRRLDEDIQITILERGDYISYANCGLPYHVGDIIKSRDALLLQTPQAMKSKFNIDVKVKNEVVAINRDKKTVQVKDLTDGKMYELEYDNLVIATGSSPLRPPIKGIESSKIQTLWTVNDADKIKFAIASQNVKKIAVIGGGFIGLEIAENLKHLGLDVSIIEAANQVMAPIDFEMAALLHENIKQNGIELYLNDAVDYFEETKDFITVGLSSGKKVDADMVVIAIGVRPNSQLAKTAGLDLNARGGIIVDDSLKTSDPYIYAVGDVIEVEDLIFRDRTMIPLAGPANKQGRIAANNIAGLNQTYKGSQGTSVAKVFDLTVAATGANEKTLNKRGLIKGKDYESIIINQNSHAGYYPNATMMTMKMLFSIDGKVIFGAQIVGTDGVDKRIDVMATAIRLGATVEQLKELELAYAPPFGSAKDVINMAGFVAENVINKLVVFSDFDISNANAVLLDVREHSELMMFKLPDAVHIPLGQLRDRLNELDPNKPIITFCAIGVRSYNAARILMENGFKDVKVYPAGTRFYKSITK